MSEAPPPYSDAPKYPTQPPQQPMPTVLPQPQAPPQQTVIIGGATPSVTYVAPTNVVVVHQIKAAPSFDPYPEMCPYCNIQVVTVRRFRQGSMFCVFLILGIIFWPFLCFLCCVAFQDAYHYCPNCMRLISVRRR